MWGNGSTAEPERVPEMLAHGGLCQVRFTDLCLINTLVFFFFLILENLLGLHVQLLSSDFEKVFST